MFGKEPDENNINGSEFQLVIERYESMMFDEQVGFFEEDEFELIIDFYESRNELDKAMRAAEHAFIQYPFSAYFLIKKAELLFEARDIDAAFEMLKRAEVLDASEIEIQLLKADLLSYRGEYSRAINLLKKAQRQVDHEELPEVLIAQADVYEAWEKFEMVFHVLKKVLLLDALNEEALQRIWLAVDITEKYGESIELHKKLIDKDPYNYQAWYNLGQAYKGLGLFEKAAEAMEYVTLIDEGHDMAFRDLAEIWLRLDEPQKALDCFRRVIEMDEEYEEIYFGMGEANELMGNYGKARYYFRKAVHLDPYYSDAFFRIGENFRKEKRLSDAMQSYKKALKLEGDNVEYLARFGEVSLELGFKEEAIQNYKKIIRLEPHDIEGYLRLSRLMMDLEERSELAELINQAVVTVGEEPRLLYVLGAILMAEGKRQQAMLVITEALNKDFRNYPLLFEMHSPLIHDRDLLDLIDLFKEN